MSSHTFLELGHYICNVSYIVNRETISISLKNSCVKQTCWTQEIFVRYRFQIPRTYHASLQTAIVKQHILRRDDKNKAFEYLDWIIKIRHEMWLYFFKCGRMRHYIIYLISGLNMPEAGQASGHLSCDTAYMDFMNLAILLKVLVTWIYISPYYI